MGDSPYRFHNLWQLVAPPDDVFRALEQVADYPLWWAEMRAVQALDDATFEITCRSVLPYTLHFTTAQARTDRGSRILEARLTGDLEGTCRWAVGSAPTGTSADFTQEVVVRKALLRRLDPIARPAFKANHTRMMRSGERGLRTYLAGHRAKLD